MFVMLPFFLSVRLELVAVCIQCKVGFTGHNRLEISKLKVSGKSDKSRDREVYIEGY